MLTIATLLNKGDELILFDPYFPSYEGLSEILNCNIREKFV